MLDVARFFETAARRRSNRSNPLTSPPKTTVVETRSNHRLTGKLTGVFKAFHGGRETLWRREIGPTSAAFLMRFGSSPVTRTYNLLVRSQAKRGCWRPPEASGPQAFGAALAARDHLRQLEASAVSIDFDQLPELLVLVADEFDQLLVRKEALVDAHRPRPVVRLRIVDGHIDL